MPIRGKRYTGRRIRPGIERRIRIPQPPDRPLTIRSKDVLRKELLEPDPWWWTTHRRGPYRPWVGTDPLEMRAVSHDQVRGTLPERILWLALVKLVHLSPGSDFSFQSSLSGGRIEFGGIVADFVLPNMMVIIRVQGPTHTQFIRIQKDDEQRGTLEEMGYTVWDLYDYDIYDEYKLEDWLRLHFGLSIGNASYAGTAANRVAPAMAIHNPAEEEEELDRARLHEIAMLNEQIWEKVVWLTEVLVQY